MILDEWEKMEGTYNKTGVDTLAQIKSEDIPLAQVGFQMFTESGNFYRHFEFWAILVV